MQTQWTEAHREEVEGFLIVFSTRPEEISPREWFGTFDDDLVRMLEDGTMCWFTARVEAQREGITLATEYLGCCDYKTPKDFVEQKDGYYAQMVKDAIGCARVVIRNLAESQ